EPFGRAGPGRANPQSTAFKVAFAALYGSKHPYGHLALGSDASIAATTRADLEAFWKRNYVPNNAALIVAGDVTVATLRPLLERTFGGWTAGRPAVAAAAAPQPTSARVVVVDSAGAQQSMVVLGSVAAARSTPDYPRMQVLNAITGGLFSSRINM